jgi:hypothetical protein
LKQEVQSLTAVKSEYFFAFLIRSSPAFFQHNRPDLKIFFRDGIIFLLTRLMESIYTYNMTRNRTTSDRGKAALGRLRKIKPFIQASLTLTKKRCGNPRCRCAQEGPLHQVALLTWKEEKRTRTLYVPLKLRQEVETWVQEGKLLKRLVAEVSQAQREFLTSKKKSSKG